LPALRLVPEVLPPHEYDKGNSIDLVADGLDLMLRLGWKEGARMIEVWQNGTDYFGAKALEHFHHLNMGGHLDL
jgi:hypothetical protein